jgi:hypothetical protein
LEGIAKHLNFNVQRGSKDREQPVEKLTDGGYILSNAKPASASKN